MGTGVTSLPLSPDKINTLLIIHTFKVFCNGQFYTPLKFRLHFRNKLALVFDDFYMLLHSDKQVNTFYKHFKK